MSRYDKETREAILGSVLEFLKQPEIAGTSPSDIASKLEIGTEELYAIMTGAPCHLIQEQWEHLEAMCRPMKTSALDEEWGEILFYEPLTEQKKADGISLTGHSMCLRKKFLQNLESQNVITEYLSLYFVPNKKVILFQFGAGVGVKSLLKISKRNNTGSLNMNGFYRRFNLDPAGFRGIYFPVLETIKGEEFWVIYLNNREA